MFKIRKLLLIFLIGVFCLSPLYAEYRTIVYFRNEDKPVIGGYIPNNNLDSIRFWDYGKAEKTNNGWIFRTSPIRNKIPFLIRFDIPHARKRIRYIAFSGNINGWAGVTFKYSYKAPGAFGFFELYNGRLDRKLNNWVLGNLNALQTSISQADLDFEIFYTPYFSSTKNTAADNPHFRISHMEIVWDE